MRSEDLCYVLGCRPYAYACTGNAFTDEPISTVECSRSSI